MNLMHNYDFDVFLGDIQSLAFCAWCSNWCMVAARRRASRMSPRTTADGGDSPHWPRARWFICAHMSIAAHHRRPRCGRGWWRCVAGRAMRTHVLPSKYVCLHKPYVEIAKHWKCWNFGCFSRFWRWRLVLIDPILFPPPKLCSWRLQRWVLEVLDRICCWVMWFQNLVFEITLTWPRPRSPCSQLIWIKPLFVDSLETHVRGCSNWKVLKKHNASCQTSIFLDFLSTLRPFLESNFFSVQKVKHLIRIASARAFQRCIKLHHMFPSSKVSILGGITLMWLQLGRNLDMC